MQSADPKLSPASQLNTLRALHKLEKQKRGDSLEKDTPVKQGEGDNRSNAPNDQSNPQKDKSQPSDQKSGMKSQPEKQSEGSMYPPTNMSVRMASSSQPFKESERPLGKSRELKKSPPKTAKRDISITLSAYNVQLKRAEDKEFFKLREEFGNALIKLESLDTRDLVDSA